MPHQTPIYVADSIASGETAEYRKSIKSARRVNVVRLFEDGSSTGALYAKPYVVSDDGERSHFAFAATDGPDQPDTTLGDRGVLVPPTAPLTLPRPTEVEKNSEFVLEVENTGSSAANLRAVASTLSAVTNLEEGSL